MRETTTAPPLWIRFLSEQKPYFEYTSEELEGVLNDIETPHFVRSRLKIELKKRKDEGNKGS